MKQDRIDPSDLSRAKSWDVAHLAVCKNRSVGHYHVCNDGFAGYHWEKKRRTPARQKRPSNRAVRPLCAVCASVRRDVALVDRQHLNFLKVVRYWPVSGRSYFINVGVRKSGKVVYNEVTMATRTMTMTRKVDASVQPWI
jgi:hypothetical protein